ncbi:MULTISPECIES: diphosphomevalonate decarboxylase [Enterococcus]|uniref:diphosphomevalonate decarboxylase n=1 Tax=Enterococcus lemanii TaxID=1159752 RepID=A0ABV9MVG5_9ENTE|nr:MULTISPECIES: diphosphomevalonate decarboxylase [Enterococcus]MBD9903433.1 diphosphomevalonate decarboxylase [Enterococcus faecium]MBM7709537.1 diphosphomevalonate decarboxylase [Enterococcus lemanii]
MYKGKARAYTNIALIKYWGKANQELILPMNNSLSLTLDAFYTETEVIFSSEQTKDTLILNGQLQDQKATQKISTFLTLVRTMADVSFYATVNSQNFVPTAAGLASSASGLAALAGACNAALNLNLSDKDLSRLARRGSGSACRSIFGGFVEWEKGDSDATSYASKIPSNDWEKDLAMIFILINDQQKDVSSRDGMERTVASSCYYPGWLETTPQDLKMAKQAIANQDFQTLGEVTEANGLKMHATTLGANPPFTYWSPDSLKAMNLVRQIRQAGTPCYFTMDAGPNVKVLCKKQDVSTILAALQKEFPAEQLTCASAGRGIEILETDVNL